MKSLRLFVVLLVLVTTNLRAQSGIVLSHSIGNDLLPDGKIFACSGGGLRWARTFVLEDFGIEPDKDFVITSGDMGIHSVSSFDTNIKFNIYIIDQNFPESLPSATLLGSSQVYPLYYSSGLPQIKTITFDTPVTVPAGTEIILVEVEQVQLYGNSSPAIFAASTAEDNDVSWFKSCVAPGYMDTVDVNYPDANFYITVTGDITASTENFVYNYIDVYPNPARDNINIKTHKNLKSYEITSLLGQVFTKGSFQSGQSIDLGNLNTGVYLLSMYADDGSTISRKIVKE
ncbi:T9SS type A sorting domain-containing protein [Flavobacterium subsaxonicum]|uniref:Secretion system C-terminal sorting domain-containing protein n=1 Tax=Flavobacterium subsaxonicum WB 4.1-42 = DSM 21790 TaxID=1121898 RepID=A0A0A2MLP1_9FLAO|nr:T9SS type A sorting domain-containing protein [Flavobacterium subsaxonicum]KGO93209.1 hypothetical protein Q766_07840 [Flavobacterium subsaxonicum WB 4.1-42 = DSM 21790]